MNTYREILEEAGEKKVAVGHFNFSTIDGLHAIFDAAKELGLPIIVGLSEGERHFIGARQAVALIKSLRQEHNHPVFLNADHCKSFESFKEVVDLGFDSVIFDGTELPFEENIRITKKCVEYAKSVNPEMLVEAEIGYIGTSSKILDEIPEGAAVAEEEITKPEEAKKFVQETGIDLFAPSVGNIHGMLRESSNPKLFIKRIEEIKEAVKIPLVLHGGSGITDEDFTDAISAGITVVHINTEIRKAWRETLDLKLEEKPDEIAPYKILKSSYKAVYDIVKKRLRLFSNLE